MKILFLEPFFGGSHRDFALGFKAHSRHEVTLLTLPARFWKWRMRGAALYFARQIDALHDYDAIFAGSMIDLSDFKALAGGFVPPVLLYFHENQLSYPLAPGEKRDLHLGFTNIISILCADRAVFNSRFHMAAFNEEAKQLLKRMPDAVPKGIMAEIKAKSSVIYPGCRFDPEGAVRRGDPDGDPLIIWNHRWEHDKNPEGFFDVVGRLYDRNIPFSLAVLGERFDKAPAVFEEAREKFKDRIVVFGYAESREAYLNWLKKGRVVVSCANQENFGISVVEAVRYGCLPLLPDRLSYPEVMPSLCHEEVLYQSPEDCAQKLKKMLTDPDAFQGLSERLFREMAQFSWENQVEYFDDLLFELAG